ncbi:VP91 [Penaeus vannamei nudivirus]|nr:VP91 [Penaeus vannamei nucleopolyhedrovirus]
MNVFIYLLVVFIFITILIIYYFIQKPKKSKNVEDVYSKYLLSEDTPDTAFTYKRRSDGKYENYYLNFDTEGDLLKMVVSDYPVTKTGEDYKPKEHGTLTENENGFRISGVAADFKCPDGWIWNSNKKTCSLIPICGSDDEGKIKGLDFYYFNLAKSMGLIKSATKYHERLYITCLEDQSYNIKTCPDNMLFNELPIQDDTGELPCKFYDICEGMRNYEFHRQQISEDVVLEPSQYYMCFNGISNLKQCEEGAFFNEELGGCLEENQCMGKPDGFTLPSDLNSYILCQNEQEYSIYCKDGIYEALGPNALSCSIDKSQTYFKYFTNDFISIPIGLYVYKNNQKSERYAQTEMVKKSMALEPSTSRFFGAVRNDMLYDPVEYQKYFITYLDNTTLEDSVEVELDKTNYQIFNPKALVSACYYVHRLPAFDWNIFEDVPVSDYVNKESSYYYKYDKVIKHTKDDTFSENSIDYFFFCTAQHLYKPVDPTVIVTDEASGILCYADFKMSRFGISSNYSKAFTVLKFANMGDSTILYYVDPYENAMIAAAFDNSVILSDFVNVTDDGYTCTPKMFTYDELKNDKPNEYFYIRMSSIKYDGVVDNTMSRYVLPEILLLVDLKVATQMGKFFTILNTENLNIASDLTVFSTIVEDSFIPITEHTENISYFENVLDLLYQDHVSNGSS